MAENDMSKFTLGIDYGTLSARCVLMNCSDGSVWASAAMAYPHAVMDRELPDGTPLRGSWALQDAEDYLLALEETVRKVMEESGVSREDVIGLSIADYGVNLLIISIGYVPGGTAPIFTEGEINQLSYFVDPIPQALTLTSIVIGACVTAMSMSLVMKLHESYGTLDTREIRRLHG